MSNWAQIQKEYDDRVPLKDILQAHALTRGRWNHACRKGRIILRKRKRFSGVCSRCREPKPLTSFYRKKSGAYHTHCRECRMADSKKRIYGLSGEQITKLLSESNGVCQSCGEPETMLSKGGKTIASLAIDHDHATGRVRGLLCRRCNVVLGLCQDDQAVLKKVSDGLSQYLNQ